jgi:PAS domain S-box-containing protein
MPMKDQSKTKQALIHELSSLRQRNADLERLESERKLIEQEVRESEQFLHFIVDNLHAGIYASDDNFCFTYVNNKLCEISGYAREELLGMDLRRLIAEESLPLVIDRYIRRRNGEDVPPLYEFIGVNKNGDKRSYESTATVVKYPDGRVRTIGQLLDITERKRAEEALHESEVRFRDLAEMLPAVVYEADENLRLVFANRKAFEIFGYTQDELDAGIEILSIVIPDDRKRVIENFLRRCQGEELGAIEYTGVKKDGSLFPILLNNAPIQRDGKLFGVRGIAIDITDRKETEGALRESEAKFRNLAESSSSGIFLLQGTKYVYVNPAFESITGYAIEDLAGMNFWDFIHPDCLDLVKNRGLNRLKGENQPPRYEIKFITKIGEIKWADFSATVITLDNKPTIMGSVFDITKSKDAEDNIRKLNDELEQRVIKRTEELEAANKEMESFSYSVSHDLRAPLRAIDGFSHLLTEKFAEKIPSGAQRYLGLMRSNVQHMNTLIENLLTFSRTSRQSLVKEEVFPAETVKEVLNELSPMQEERSIKISIGNFPVCRADPALLKVVYVNLLSNALKFTSKREVAVIDVGSQIINNNQVYYVKDNGVGFDMKYIDKLFGVFQRLHSATDFEGTGVGMSIVQRVINRHGGKIWAESEVDKGAAFYFTLGT